MISKAGRSDNGAQRVIAITPAIAGCAKKTSHVPTWDLSSFFSTPVEKNISNSLKPSYQRTSHL
jgi:hypothetical protein